VSDQDQLQWEARFGRPAAVAALAAGILLLAGTFLSLSNFEDRPHISRLADSLVSVDENPGTWIASSALQALSSLCLIAVFYYLFRATAHRLPQFPSWFRYVVVVAPVLYAISQVLGSIDRADVAQMFVDKTSHVGDFCPAIRGRAGDECADDLLKEQLSPVLIGLSLAGLVGTAFLFVMLPLRARRAGLMSQFMGILGVIAGALMVLQLAPLVPQIVQAFWLGAVGALFLGSWPGGRGSAWETADADPWPTAAQRRGLVPAGGADGAVTSGNGAAAEPAEREPVPQRPSSRKRRRKRR
jgi:hypothetical protein